MNYHYLMIIATLAVTACEDKKVYDVQYYLDHEKERVAMLEKCKNNPGELSKDANCINAQTAQHKIIFNPENTKMPSIDGWQDYLKKK